MYNANSWEPHACNEPQLVLPTNLRTSAFAPEGPKQLDSFITLCANCISKGCLMLSDANANTIRSSPEEPRCEGARLQAERQHGDEVRVGAAVGMSAIIPRGVASAQPAEQLPLGQNSEQPLWPRSWKCVWLGMAWPSRQGDMASSTSERRTRAAAPRLTQSTEATALPWKPRPMPEKRVSNELLEQGSSSVDGFGHELLDKSSLRSGSKLESKPESRTESKPESKPESNDVIVQSSPSQV